MLGRTRARAMVAACLGRVRYPVVGRRCCVAAVDRGLRGHDACGGARRVGDAGVGARFDGGGGTDREVRAERRAIASCGRMVGAGSPAPQPVALAPACGGGSVGPRRRGPRCDHHRGDRGGVGRSRVRQRVPSRTSRGGDALRDPPRGRRDARRQVGERRGHPPGARRHRAPRGRLDRSRRRAASDREQPRVRRVDPHRRIDPGREVTDAGGERRAAGRAVVLSVHGNGGARGHRRRRGRGDRRGRPSSGGSRSGSANATPRPSSSSGSPASRGCWPRSAACSASRSS